MDIRLARCVCCEEHIDENIVALTYGVDQLAPQPILIALYLVHPTESGLTFVSPKLQGSYCLSELYKIHDRDNYQHCKRTDRNYAGIEWTHMMTDDVIRHLATLLPRYASQVTQEVQDTVAAIREHYRQQAELSELSSRFGVVQKTLKKRSPGGHSSTKPITKEIVETSLRRVTSYFNLHPNTHMQVHPTFQPGVSRIFDAQKPVAFNANLPLAMGFGISTYGVNFAHIAYKIFQNTRFIARTEDLCGYLHGKLEFGTSVAERLIEARALFINNRYQPVTEATLDVLMQDAALLVDQIPPATKLRRRV